MVRSPLILSLLLPPARVGTRFLCAQSAALHSVAHVLLYYTVLFACLRCVFHVRLLSALCVTCSNVRALEYFVFAALLALAYFVLV